MPWPILQPRRNSVQKQSRYWAWFLYAFFVFALFVAYFECFNLLLGPSAFFCAA